MDAMMIPAQTTSKATIPGGGSGRTGGKSQESFAEYMDRKLNDAGREKNLLGVKAKNSKAAKAAGPASQKADKSKEADDAMNAAALLAQFLQDLKDMAKDTEKNSGEWSFAVPDDGILKKLALDAGMDEKKLAALLQQSAEQGNVIDLKNFLETLTRHFTEQAEDVDVKVSETDLPFFETLLSKLGAPIEQIVDVADQSATGDGKLDLKAFLESLQDVTENGKPIALSDWETSQLRDIFSKAGVAEDLQNQLLPKQNDAPFTLATLREMLQKGIENVKDSRPKLDLPAFLKDLQQVFADAKFNDKTAGWSPAVQEAVSSAYQELLKSVDLSTVQAKVVPPPVQTPGKPATMDVDEDQLRDLHGLDGSEGVEAEEAAVPEQAKEHAGNGEMAGQNQGQAMGQSAAAGTVTAGMSAEGHAAAAAAAGHHVGSESQTVSAQQGQHLTTPPRMAQEVVQQTFHNISNSVLNGLRNNEHHLVLRLYPRELGEVKVEMTVREQNVSLSFSMENHRVKETLESNMQQFQDNLSKHGFTLQGCQVSVGQQQEDPNSAWQFLEQARQLGQGKGGRETLADLPADSMYIRPIPGAVREGGISLFI